MAKAQLKEVVVETEEQAEVSGYRRFYQSVKKKLSEAGDRINAQTFKTAVDKAVVELKDAGEYSAEAIKRMTQALRKDIASSAEKLGPNWEKLRSKTHDFFDIWQDRSTVFIGHAASELGEWLHNKGDKLEHHVYKAGELTYGGTFVCTSCNERLEIHKAGYLQPCPNCLKSEFRRA